jgi:hypothetical protein
VPWQEAGKLALVVIVVDEFFGGYHVQELEHAAFFKIGGRGACEHGHGIYAHLETRCLRHADASALHFKIPVAELHAIQAFNGDVC